MPDQPVNLATVQMLLAQLADATREAAAATLAAAVVQASGKPTSIEKLLGIMRDIRFASSAPQNNGVYEAWAKTKDERLSKVYD